MEQHDPNPPSGNYPSEPTTNLILREVNHIRELLEARIDAIEAATRVAHADLVRVPTDVDKQISNLRAQIEEKFQTISCRIDAGEKAASKQDDTFKLSIDKSETYITKQIDGLGDTLKTDVGGLRLQHDDVKQRLTKIEGMNLGSRETTGTTQRSNSFVVAVISVVISALALMAVLIREIIR